MMLQRVVITGGSGFVGSAIVKRLAEAGVTAIVPTRKLSRASHLAPQAGVEVVEADIHDPEALGRLLEGADALVNLVGVLHSRSGKPYGEDFAHAHVDLPRKLVAACQQQQVPRLVHISALGAGTDGPSEYQRSKADGEAAIKEAGDSPAWTILRPSVIFGPGDSFLNLFAWLARLFPALPLAGANARFQPVYVGDVAEVVWRCLNQPEATGKAFELAGPNIYTLRQLVEYVCRLIGKKRLVIPLPDALGMVQAGAMELLPNPLMSRDNIRSMQRDNIATAEPLPFCMEPTALESIAPEYIGRRQGAKD